MKKNHLVKNLRKGLILGVTLTFLCFAGACGTKDNIDNNSSGSGDMAGTGSSERESGVLDQGGANPTDNDSLWDGSNGSGTNGKDDGNRYDGSLGSDANDVLDDIGDAAGDLINGVENGVDDLTGNGSSNGTTTGNGGTNNSNGTTTGEGGVGSNIGTGGGSTRSGMGVGTGSGGYGGMGSGTMQ